MFRLIWDHTKDCTGVILYVIWYGGILQACLQICMYLMTVFICVYVCTYVCSIKIFKSIKIAKHIKWEV